MGQAPDLRRPLSARGAFILAAATVATAVLLAAVARPAVERGGWGELAALVVAIAAVLLVERWLRGR